VVTLHLTARRYGIRVSKTTPRTCSTAVTMLGICYSTETLATTMDDDGFQSCDQLLDDSRGLSAVADFILKCDYIQIPSWQLFSLAVGCPSPRGGILTSLAELSTHLSETGAWSSIILLSRRRATQFANKISRFGLCIENAREKIRALYRRTLGSV
jgi:hypothetical protein